MPYVIPCTNEWRIYFWNPSSFSQVDYLEQLVQGLIYTTRLENENPCLLCFVSRPNELGSCRRPSILTLLLGGGGSVCIHCILTLSLGLGLLYAQHLWTSGPECSMSLRTFAYLPEWSYSACMASIHSWGCSQLCWAESFPDLPHSLQGFPGSSPGDITQ